MRTRPHVHLIGIGGIGVSALARLYLAQNWSVSGSDASDGALLMELAREGVEVKIGHSASNIPKETSLVVHTVAIPTDNPELAAARERDILVRTYPEALGEITRAYRTICIAGSHGKSTTTSMVALILMRAGLDPTVIVGSKLKEFGNSNFRRGASEYFVLEADEYRGAFLHYAPSAVAVTNIDFEHPDYYPTPRAVEQAFRDFLGRVVPNGSVIMNGDDARSVSVAKYFDQQRSILWFSKKLRSRRAVLAKLLKVPGEHNIMNALAAWALTESLGVPERTILAALRSFTGIWRRTEYKGFARYGTHITRVYDDYAHHPTEIRAALQAMRASYPRAYRICVCQPHDAHRLETLVKEFADSFTDAHALILFPTYQPVGREVVAERVTAEYLASLVARKHPKISVSYLADPSYLVEQVASLLDPLPRGRQAVVLMAGAGSIASQTRAVLKQKR